MGFIESSVAQLKFQTGIATTTLTNCHPYGSQVAFKIKLFFRAAPWRFAISHPQGILGPGESILVEFKFKGGRKRRSLPPPVWIKGAFVVIAAPIANAAIPPSQSRFLNPTNPFARSAWKQVFHFRGEQKIKLSLSFPAVCEEQYQRFNSGRKNHQTGFQGYLPTIPEETSEDGLEDAPEKTVEEEQQEGRRNRK